MDIYKRKLTGGLAFDDILYLSVSSGSDLFLFNLSDFSPIKKMQMSRGVHYLLRWKAKFFLACETQNLELVDTTNDTIIAKLTINEA